MSGLSDWFAVFRAGTHTDSRGRTATFTREDLDGMVQSYDPERPSPCVITHEELYSPFGYAKVEALRRDGDVLQARCEADSIEPQFASLVEDGRPHNRSVQIVPQPDGGYRMGHVAFLGAEPPAVEGLAPISFSAAGMEFASETAWDEYRDASSIARIMDILRRLAVKVFGEEEADAVVSSWEVTSSAEEAGARRERASRRENEAGDPSMKTYSQTEFDEALAAARAEARAAARRDTANRARIDGLVDSGRIAPAQAEGLAEFVALLPAGEVLEFSRGTGETSEQVKTSPAAHLFGLLEALPERRIVREALAGGDGPGRESGQSAGAIRARALEFMADERKRGRTIGIAQAVRHVTGADT